MKSLATHARSLDPASDPVPEQSDKLVYGLAIGGNGTPVWYEVVDFTIQVRVLGRRGHDKNPELFKGRSGPGHAAGLDDQRDSRNTVAAQDVRSKDGVFMRGS